MRPTSTLTDEVITVSRKPLGGIGMWTELLHLPLLIASRITGMVVYTAIQFRTPRAILYSTLTE